MPSLTFHLLTTTNSQAFLDSLRSLPKDSRPLYVGATHHWIHEPELSTAALTGPAPSLKGWDYIIVTPSAGADGLSFPDGINTSVVERKWSITAPVDDAWITGHKEQHPRRLSSTGPALPAGWSAADHSGLDAAVAPPDLAASLGLSSRPFGSSEPQGLKDFITTFGSKHTGSVAMFNLLAYMPNGGREQYFKYIQAFSASTGIKYGGEPLFLGAEVTDWSSKASEAEKEWVDCALVWYPSLWHFGKMLDDPEYAQVDREFKQGAIKDNPLVCCTEVDVGYAD